MFCKATVENTIKPRFSDNFMAWPLLSDGNGICDFCNKIMKDQTYRKSCWIIENGKTEFFKREKITDIIQKEKTTPFLIYVTESYKKQGFINILSRPNFSNKKFIIAFDNSVISIDTEKYSALFSLAKEAREKKFSKTELLTQPNVKHWEYEDLCISIMKVKHDPTWRLAVFAV